MEKRIEKGQTADWNQSNTPLQDVNKDKGLESQSKSENIKLNPQFDDLNPQEFLDHIKVLTKRSEAEILESLRINPTDKIDRPKTAWLQKREITEKIVFEYSLSKPNWFVSLQTHKYLGVD